MTGRRRWHSSVSDWECLSSWSSNRTVENDGLVGTSVNGRFDNDDDNDDDVDELNVNVAVRVSVVCS